MIPFFCFPASSLQFLFAKFNGCLAVGHAGTHGAVSCQEPDGSYLTDSLTGSTAAGEREGARGGRNGKGSRVERRAWERAMIEVRREGMSNWGKA